MESVMSDMRKAYLEMSIGKLEDEVLRISSDMRVNGWSVKGGRWTIKCRDFGPVVVADEKSRWRAIVMAVGFILGFYGCDEHKEKLRIIREVAEGRN